MDKLSAAIEKFVAAAEQLEAATERATKRVAARADGASAQGEIIAQLRQEIVALQAALGGRPEGVPAIEPRPLRAAAAG